MGSSTNHCINVCSYRIGSATDPDATYRVHDDQVDFSYNVSVAATENFIREIRADKRVSPLISHEKPTGRFGPEDFSLSADGTILTCPNGQVSTTAYRSGSGEGRNFRFFADLCAGCPFWDLCRDPDANPHGMRQAFITDHRPFVEAAKAYNQTDEFKADMKLRPLIERIVATLTRYNGGRWARSRGQPKADFQAKPVPSLPKG